MTTPFYKIKMIIAHATALCGIAGCATPTLDMNANTRVPAARGEVRTAEEKNGNTRVKVSVEHMAMPQAVDPVAQTYVVWAQDNMNSGHVQNLGAIQVDDDLEGELESITAMKRFDLFITPEPVTTAQQPTGAKTLWTTVD